MSSDVASDRLRNVRWAIEAWRDADVDEADFVALGEEIIDAVARLDEHMTTWGPSHLPKDWQERRMHPDVMQLWTYATGRDR